MIYGGEVTWLFDPRFRYVVVNRFCFNSAWDIPHYVTINLYHQKFGNQIYHETLAISLPTKALTIWGYLLSMQMDTDGYRPSRATPANLIS